MQQEKQDEAETCISSACVEESSIKYGASQTSRKKQEGGHMYNWNHFAETITSAEIFVIWTRQTSMYLCQDSLTHQPFGSCRVSSMGNFYKMN